MALKISKNIELTDVVSDSNPITTKHDIAGTAASIRLFLFNDNPQKRYTGITITPIDTVDNDESNWVQLAPDVAGAAGDYSSILSMAESTIVPVPFWVTVTTPGMPDTINKEDLGLRVIADEHAI